MSNQCDCTISIPLSQPSFPPRVAPMSEPIVVQTRTPVQISGKPSKQELVDEYKGKPLNVVRTPAVIIDRAVFARNCAKMHENAKQWGASFRAHVKSHKTSEGTKLQLISSADQTHAIVVSTLMEAWEVVRSGLVADGAVKDILYGLPLALNRVEDISSLQDEVEPFGAQVRVLIDHPDQAKFLESFERNRQGDRKWSVFVKVECGHKRAGLEPTSPEMNTLLRVLLSSPAISVFGFYTHGGQSYASKSMPEATLYLTKEIEAVNSAAGTALSILKELADAAPTREPFVLAVGSTPTAHAATAEARAQLETYLNGKLEIHAGNYPLLDLQQVHTSLVDTSRVSQSILTTVVSYYPGRGEGGTDEALCDAGATALSKDSGPTGGFGQVVGKSWRLGRLSQEHGVLTRLTPVSLAEQDEKLQIGDIVQVVGQHACLILAGHLWYYVVDSDAPSKGGVIEDVWVPWNGW